LAIVGFVLRAKIGQIVHPPVSAVPDQTSSTAPPPPPPPADTSSAAAPSPSASSTAAASASGAASDILDIDALEKKPGTFAYGKPISSTAPATSATAKGKGAGKGKVPDAGMNLGF
ncbi:MAG: hypothetical protein ACREJX_17570, partial [Polyangiaceae bacterium]